jgi:hypothetical protein
MVNIFLGVLVFELPLFLAHEYFKYFRLEALVLVFEP